MMRRHNRLLVLLYVMTDAILGMAAFGLAYASGSTAAIPVWKGIPPVEWYVSLLPWVGALVPIAYHVQGLYRLRRGRSRVDDFFAVFVGSTLAVVLGIIGTLYYSTYYLSDELKNRGRLRSRAARLADLPGHQRHASPTPPAKWFARCWTAAGRLASDSSGC